MGKPVSIRQNLILNLVLVIVLLTSAILLTTTLTAKSDIQNLSGRIINQTIEQADEKLDGFFTPVAEELLRMKSLGENGLLSLNEPNLLKKQFKPIMQHFPQISSILLADDFGRDFMLLKKKNSWLNRQMGHDQQATITEWNNSGYQLSTKTIRMDYDPRKRPWFLSATQKWDTGENPDAQNDSLELLSWTTPYILFTTKEPGITVSIRFKAPDLSEYVLGIDVLLKDIQAFVDNLKILNRGQFVILTAEQSARVIAGKTDISGTEPLKKVKHMNVPLIQDTMSAFQGHKKTDMNGPIRFSSQGQIWWGAGKRFFISQNQHLQMCVIVPESDLSGSMKTERIWILIVSAGILIFGLYRVIVIANRYSRPIESLVVSTKRISKGNFEHDQPIQSTIYEVRKLGEAHELMRKGLKNLVKLESDMKIAHDVQQKTFPGTAPNIPGFNIAGWNMPANETGGDSYDIIGYEIDPETKTINICDKDAQKAILLLGDAAGHGLGPALSVTELRAMLRMGVHMNPDIPTLLEHINEQLHVDLPAGRFITAWLGQIDAATQTLTYFSAGQAPLLYFKANENRVDTLEADTFPLGIAGVLDLSNINHIKMKRKDIFAVISDGIFEAVNDQNELFGKERVIAVLKKEKDKPSGKIIKRLREEVDLFTNNSPATDDRTILIIKKN